MRLDTLYLLDLLLAYLYLDQSHLGKQGQHHCRRWYRCHAFVAWDLLVMRAQVETDLSLDHAGDQQADDRAHGRVPGACGYYFGTSPKPSVSSDPAGSKPSKAVFNLSLAPVGL